MVDPAVREYRAKAKKEDYKSSRHSGNALTTAAVGITASGLRKPGKPKMSTQAKDFAHNTKLVGQAWRKEPKRVKDVGKLMKVNVKGNALGVVGLGAAGYAGSEIGRSVLAHRRAEGHRQSANALNRKIKNG